MGLDKFEGLFVATKRKFRECFEGRCQFRDGVFVIVVIFAGFIGGGGDGGRGGGCGGGFGIEDLDFSLRLRILGLIDFGYWDRRGFWFWRDILDPRVE